MPTAKKSQIEGHIHVWHNTGNPAEMKCNCGKILVSPQELQRRQAEWDQYYEDCQTTEAAFDFWEMRKAYFGDKKVCDEVLERVKTRMVRNDDDQLLDVPGTERLPKPHFPNPEGWMYEVNI